MLIKGREPGAMIYCRRKCKLLQTLLNGNLARCDHKPEGQTQSMAQ